MNKKMKIFGKFFALTALVVTLVQVSKPAKADTAWGCSYTGSYVSACTYGGYYIIKCQYGITTCGFTPREIILEQ